MKPISDIKTKNSIKREQSQARLGSAERENFRTKFKVLAAVLTIAALATGQEAAAQDPATIGSISYNSTLGAYEIASENNLHDLAVYVNGAGSYTTVGEETTAHDCEGLTFKMTRDITFTASAAWNAESDQNNYTAIGGIANSQERYFKGTFDGQGHTVSGIRIYKNGTGFAYNYLGLFGYIDRDGTVKNLRLSNARIMGNSHIGGFAGLIDGGTVENCHVGEDVAIVSCSNGVNAGGIAGSTAHNAVISGCTCAAIVTNQQAVGGIVGANNNGTISHCLVIGASITGNIEYDPVAGKNVGTLTYNYHYGCTVNGATANHDINGCRKAVTHTLNTNVSSTVTVTPASPDLVYAYDGIKANSAAMAYGNKLYARASTTTNVSFTVTPPAGYTVSNVSGATANGDGSYTVSMGTTDGSSTVSLSTIAYSIAYDLDGGTDGGNPTTYTVQTNSFTLAAPTKSSHLFIGWSGTGIDGITRTVTIAKGSTGDRTYTAHWKNTSAYYAGTGTETDPYIISTKEEWGNLVTNSTDHDFDGQYIQLADDIGTSGDPVTVILAKNSAYPFKGKLNGDGHAITINLTDEATDNGVALIRFADSGCDIKNLVVKGNITTSKVEAAGFISNIPSGSKTITISNSRSSVVINTTYEKTDVAPKNACNSGGFVGKGYANVNVTLNNCLFDGAFISETVQYVGGMVGYCATPKFYSCLVSPTNALSLTYSGTNYTFSRSVESSSFNNSQPSYYRTAIGTAQGTDGSGMTAEALAEALGSNWELVGGEVLPIMDSRHLKKATVSNLKQYYKTTGSAIDLEYSVTDGIGRTLTKGIDYIETITNSRGMIVTSILAEDDYTLTLSGTGSYRGTLTFLVGVGRLPDGMEEDEVTAKSYHYPNYSHFFVKMPSGTDTKTVTLTDNIRKFKVYDDGGRSSNYSKNCNATLTLTAPEDFVLRISGTIRTNSSSHYLTINGGDHLYSSGESKNIGTITSEGPTMTLYFESTASNTATGLDLTVELIPEFIELSEDEGITDAIATQIAGQKVRFRRTFKAGRASTVCLPFAMTSVSGGKVYEFVSVGYDDAENVKAWVATMSDATPGNLITATTANQPFLFLPDIPGGGAEGDEVTVTFSGTAGATVTAGESTSGDWKFRGTFERLEFGTNLTGHVYGFASKDKEVDGVAVKAGEFVKAKDGAAVPPMRCYLTYKNGEEFTGAPARGTTRSAEVEELPQTIIVRLVGSNGETANVMTLDTRTGEISDAMGWYSMDGRRLSGKPTTKGIYINNGRKVVIK